MDELDLLERSTETIKVRAWRRDEAARLGLNYLDAELFADSDGDLTRLRDLIRAGCDPSVAVAILV